MKVAEFVAKPLRDAGSTTAYAETYAIRDDQMKIAKTKWPYSIASTTFPRVRDGITQPLTNFYESTVSNHAADDCYLQRATPQH